MATPSQFGKLRIIGGTWRGRKIAPPSGFSDRPSTDRVRESLFNCLGQQLHGLRCLDAFAGSGILGLEAVSRGAAHVTFVDKKKSNADSIRGVTKTLNAPTTIRHAPLKRFLRHNTADFDLVFLDPPFADYPDDAAWAALLSDISPHLADGGRVYCESDKPITPPQTNWQTLTEKRTGQVFWRIFAKTP